MPAKTKSTTHQQLMNVPLPKHGDTYTVIPHQTVIEKSTAALLTKGFTIESSKYKANHNGNIAQGIHKIKHSSDKDLGMMFVWTNSYDKSTRFKCAIGANVYICDNGLIRGDVATYARKHTGDALNEVNQTIREHVNKAHTEFEIIIRDKEALKDIILSKKRQGEILGRMFIEKDILTLTQVGIVKKEIEKPTFSYNADVNSAWSFYNHITLALKESHPGSWLDDHKAIHQVFVDEFGMLTQPAPEPDLFTNISGVPSVIFQ